MDTVTALLFTLAFFSPVIIVQAIEQLRKIAK